jgi:hypothetical protein
MLGKRRLHWLVAACALVPLVAAAAQHRGPAPADEYFGPFKESILGIRNHLHDLEVKSDRDLLVASVITGIDNIEIAIEDWHAQYPQDPWLPRFLNRIVHVYARAHSINHTHALEAVALLEHEYPRTAYAKDAIAVMKAERMKR